MMFCLKNLKLVLLQGIDEQRNLFENIVLHRKYTYVYYKSELRKTLNHKKMRGCLKNHPVYRESQYLKYCKIGRTV